MSPTTSSVSLDRVISRMREALDDDAVLVDEASRSYFANDIFWQPGILPEAIVLPATQQKAVEAIRLACAAGLAVVPRGGGMSYSKGYLPATPGALVVDTRRLNRVLEVNAIDRYITVEAGCTWADVDAALDGTGLRTAGWGPLSGRIATVGGALAQNGAFYGSATNGTFGDSVIGISVVLANGTLVTTGSAGRQNTKPFTRDGGPDLTGLFVGDNGALGFKVAATLRLTPRPEHVDCLSFGFSSLAAMARAQVELSSLSSVSEAFGIDRAKVEQSASFGKPPADLTGPQVGTRVGTQGDPAIGQLKDHAFTLHLAVEGCTASVLKASTGAVRAIGRRHGVEIACTVPRTLRAHPFGPPRGMLGSDGERWVPVHAIFPISLTMEACDATEAFFAEQTCLMRDQGILHSIMTMTVGAAFFLEPSFYWRDEITPLHAHALGADLVEPWIGRPANEKARQAVIILRRKTQELYARLGGVSWQAARDYPFREIMKPESYGLLRSLKNAVDPNGQINPGALGLGLEQPVLRCSDHD